MKRIILLCAILLGTICARSQTESILGDWYGELKAQGSQLRLVFHIKENNDILTATMDSPDQMAFDLPASKVTFEDQNLTISVPKFGIKYSGKLENDQIVGTFNQAGQELPMNLVRKKIEKKEAIQRQQTPQMPYPYYTEDITFENQAANAVLAGTLTLPSKEGKYPVVVFITGSGAQNRNEELMGHQPFLVISDYLTRHGIATLRFDDRGFAKSTGKMQGATSADFSEDVECAVNYLKTRKEIDQNKIGLIGHSEGGIIAPMLASRSKDIDFIVSLAGPGLRGDKLLLMQAEAISLASGISREMTDKTLEQNKNLFDLVLNSTDDQKLRNEIADHLQKRINNGEISVPEGMSKEDYIALNMQQIADPWMIAFIRTDPTVFLKETKCAYLAINGENDLQVPFKENLEIISQTLKANGNKDVTTKSFPKMNHLFQTCKTGLPSEYGTIEETISPEVLEYITQWILKQTK